MMYHGRRNQGCITLLASVIPPYKTHMIVLADNSPLTDDDDDELLEIVVKTYKLKLFSVNTNKGSNAPLAKKAITTTRKKMKKAPKPDFY
jgi:hypothetical protein